MDRLAFYCVCDRNHFLGLVGLINSLRLVGHREPIFVYDCGLEPWQRELLEPETVLFCSQPADGRSVTEHPWLLKQVLPLETPAEVMVILDVDIIVTGHLGALTAQAQQTEKPVLFLNDRTDRFHAEWEALGFGPPIPHPYLASGQFVLPAASGETFLREFESGLRRLDIERTLMNPSIRPEDPFYYPDMDVLNAMVGTVFALDSFTVADPAAVSYWPFAGLELIDRDRLECAWASGGEPLLLHHIMTKPWAGVVAPNVFTSMLVRLLDADDLAITVPRRAVPPGLRSGSAGTLARRWLGFRAALRTQLRGKLRIRARIANWRARGALTASDP